MIYIMVSSRSTGPFGLPSCRNIFAKFIKNLILIVSETVVQINEGVAGHLDCLVVEIYLLSLSRI